VTAVNCYFWLGELTKAREHADQLLAIYSDAQHGHLADILNQDPVTQILTYTAHLTWMLGYPEQAVEISDSKDAYARRRGHPFDLGWALTVGAQVFDHLREPDEQLKRLQEAERLGRENRMPFLTELQVPVHSGVALIRKGQLAEGISSLEAGLAIWEKGGGKGNSAYCKSVVAEGMAQLGDLDASLNLIDEKRSSGRVGGSVTTTPKSCGSKAGFLR
jgi:hypothetical protein